MEQPVPDKKILIDIVTIRMPYGKHKGKLICDIPENYLVWFKGKGFPENKIGILLEQTYEIKLNGLDEILRKIKHIVRSS